MGCIIVSSTVHCVKNHLSRDNDSQMERAPGYNNYLGFIVFNFITTKMFKFEK